MGLARFNQGNNMSFEMPSTDMSYQSGGTDFNLADFTPAETYDDGMGFTQGEGFEVGSDVYENIWADDGELASVFPVEDDSDWWDSIWDFASSDNMLNFLGGAGRTALDLWKMDALNKNRSSSGRGGSGGKAVYQKDVSKIKEKPHTFKRA